MIIVFGLVLIVVGLRVSRPHERWTFWWTAGQLTALLGFVLIVAELT